MPIPTARKFSAVILVLLIALLFFLLSLVPVLHTDKQATRQDKVVATAALPVVILALCMAIVPAAGHLRLLSGSRSVWEINEGKSFAVETGDDPGIEEKLKALEGVRFVSIKELRAHRPRIRKLGIAAYPAALSFFVVILLDSSHNILVAFSLACFVGVVAASCVTLRQRLLESRW
jgi:hypothetical protein